MRKYIPLALFILSPFFSSANDLIHHSNVLNQEDCFNSVFADYDSWLKIMKVKYERRVESEEALEKLLARFKLTHSREKYETFKGNLDCRKFEYKVDTHYVKGFVIKPKIAAKKLPVLIYNRGGNGNYGGVTFGTMMGHLFAIANEGFIVIGSQYRGTYSMFDTLDEFGGSDVYDVTSLLDFVPTIEDADVNRIGMFGASRGGMQTHLAVKQLKNIKAIATIAGSTDLSKGLVYRPAMESVYMKRIPDYERNKQQELDKRSVLKWVDELSPDIPILLLHGTDDKRVSVKHSEDFAKALTKHNIPHKLVLYPGDNHGLIRNRDNVNREIVDWFNKYL